MGTALMVPGTYALLTAGLCGGGARAARRRDLLSFDLVSTRGIALDATVSGGRTL